jgi:ABC-2 type transport system ATP-binding protein
MKMKLSIAVALSHNPKLLILDEATSGLDPMVRDEILDVFNDFTRDESHSILLSSHIISDLEKICDYICFIHKGELLLVEEKDLLLEKYAVIKLAKNQLETLPKDSIVRKIRTSFGYEVLVQKDKINAAFRVENARLEDIILLMVKEGV